MQQQSHLRYYEKESTAPPFGLGLKGELRLAGAVMVATEFKAARRLSAALKGVYVVHVFKECTLSAHRDCIRTVRTAYRIVSTVCMYTDR